MRSDLCPNSGGSNTNKTQAEARAIFWVEVIVLLEVLYRLNLPSSYGEVMVVSEVMTLI